MQTLKGVSIYSVIFSKATPLFYKGHSWPKAIFRDALKVLMGLLMLVWISVGQVSIVGAGALLQDLENALMCKCDDKCGKVLMNCTCSTADKTRANF